MSPLRTRRLAPAVAVLCAAALTVVPAAPAAPVAAPASRHGGTPTSPHLPSDWPAQVPLPKGSLQGSTGRAGQWSVLLLMRGSAAEAKRSAMRFYRVHGFRRATDSIVRKGRYRVTLVVENRDHSPNETFLAIGVTRTG